MNPFFIAISILGLLLTVILHEIAHGWVADRLGDPTARLAGRLTLNPIPHIDLFGSIILPLMLFISNIGILFGWAKPVPIDLFNLKNPRRDSALIALAGPCANVILSIILAIAVRLLINIEHNIFATISLLFFSQTVKVSVFLGILNLIPIAPLDGFKVVGGILNSEKSKEWYSLERYGMIFLIALLIPVGGSNLLTFIVGTPAELLINLLLPKGL